MRPRIPPFTRATHDEASGVRLTQDQVQSLIGGLAGSILTGTAVDVVRAAFRWWANQPDDVWEAFDRKCKAVAGDPEVAALARRVHGADGPRGDDGPGD